jgi:hypothetical protein
MHLKQIQRQVCEYGWSEESLRAFSAHLHAIASSLCQDAALAGEAVEDLTSTLALSLPNMHNPSAACKAALRRRIAHLRARRNRLVGLEEER